MLKSYELIEPKSGLYFSIFNTYEGLYIDLEDFLVRLRAECRKSGLSSPHIEKHQPGSIKIRIRIRSGLHISIYFNEVTGTLTSALIMNRRRIFGYDAYPRRERWHIHPVNNVEEHIESQNLSLEEIIRKYVEILRKQRYI